MVQKSASRAYGALGSVFLEFGLAWVLAVGACASESPAQGDGGPGAGGNGGAGEGGSEGGRGGEAGNAGEGANGGSSASGGSSGASGGTGGSGGSSGSGGTGGGEECVDIVVRPSLLPGEDWVEAVDPIGNGVWRSDKGLHAAWTNGRRDSTAEDPRIYLIVATFDPETGDELGVDVHDVFPKDIGYLNSVLRGAQGMPDGRFVVGFQWWRDPTVTARDGVFFGEVGKTELTEAIITDETSEVIASFAHVGWDGEAFVVHGYTGGEKFLARVSETGEVVEPLKYWGVTPRPTFGPLGSRALTEPVSGRSFIVDYSGTPVVLGHDRSGTPLSWTDGVPKEVIVPGLPTELASHTSGAIDRDGGVWLAWNTCADLPAESFAAHLTPEGEARVGFVLKTLDDDPSSCVEYTAAASEEEGAAIIGSSWYRLYSYRVVNDELKGPEVLMEMLEDPFPLRNMQLVRYEDELWAAFAEERTNVPTSLHIVKVAPGCRYEPAVPPSPAPRESSRHEREAPRSPEGR